MFVRSPQAQAFQQGEILTEVVQITVSADSIGSSEGVDLNSLTHPFAVVLTQNCDLDWDYKARTGQVSADSREVKIVPSLLLCELHTKASLQGRGVNSGVWKRIEQNRDERYHYLPSLPSSIDSVGEGLPELVVDFKRIFSVPTDEMYIRLKHGMKRRGTLFNPYLQDVSNRFGFYWLRVALPDAVPTVTSLLGSPLPEAQQAD